MRQLLCYIGLCLILSTGLYGCGNSTTAASGQPSAVAKKATVNFNVTFPTKNAVKSLIPQGTTSVYIYWELNNPSSSSYASGDLTLFPDANNTAKASAEMEAGIYNIYADCYDANGNILSSAYNNALVSSGSNDIVITFIQGRWTFVDSLKNAAPITLSSGEILNSFDIPNSYWSTDYPLTWNLATTLPANFYSSLTYQAFSGSLSELALIFGSSMPSNLPSTPRLDLLETSYNLTQGRENYSGDLGVENDHSFIFSSLSPFDTQTGYGPTQSASPDISQYFNTQIANGTTITGTIIEFTTGPSTTPSLTTKTCTPSYQLPKSAQLNKSVASRVSKSSVIGTVTVTFTMCEPSSAQTSPTSGLPTFYEMTYSQSFSDVRVYPFTATGTDIPQGVLFKK